jgi:hypothetical protein
MSNLFGSQPKVIPEFTGLQVNTSVQVLPIPIVYGSPRISMNLIYYNGFNVQLQSTHSGKGILSGGKGAKQANYFATFISALCEGPVGVPLIIYQDQEVWTPATYPTNGAAYFDGSPGQLPWSYVVSNWPGDARSYKNTAYYAFANAQIDSSATIPQINIVLEGLLQGSSPLNNSTITITSGQYDPSGKPLSFLGPILLNDADADPAQVISDFLVNPQYGATFPPEFVDETTLFTTANGFNPSVGDSTLSSFCQATGLAWSVAIDNVQTASSIIERWTKNLNTAVVWNGALLKFIPYWDTPASGNPGWDPMNGIAKKYFTPNTTAIVNITMDQILQSSAKDEDPITFTRKDPLEVYNTIRIDFRDRNNFFNNVPVEAKDEAHIELYGPRIDNIGLADEFSLETYANLAVQMQLRRNISIMRTFTWKMGPLWGWIDPMDVLSIPDPVNYANSIIVRVISAEDDEEENVTLVAEEFPVGSQSPSTIPMSSTTPPNQGATNSPPPRVFPPVIFAPTTAMLTATGFASPQVIVGASAGIDNIFSPNWGGAFIWASLDNVSYEMVGTLTGPSTIGTLTQALPGYGGANPDNSDALVVNLSESDGVLASVTSAAAAAGNSICVIQDVSGFEIVSYTTATLIAPFTFSLTGLYRGLYGTTSRLFGAGSQFLFVGSSANFLETALPPSYVGTNFYVKLQSFNVFQSATEELSDCVAYRYLATGPTPVGPTPPPSQTATYRRLKITATDFIAKPRRRR